jgi:hypothetical protein
VTVSNRLVAVALVVTLAAATALAVLRVSDPEPSPRLVPRPAPTSALYLSGDTLSRLDLESGDTRPIGRAPTNDVHASDVSPWVAYVASGTGAPDEEDFLTEPVLRTINVDTGAANEIGPGFNPMWHPNDARLAYLRPIVERQCSGESCRGLFEVVVYEPDSEDSTVLTEPGRFNLLAWSGQRVLVANESDLSVTFSLGSKEDVERLDIEPSELWDASPNGRWLLRSDPNGATLIDLGNGEESAVKMDQSALADGAWSPDSKHIVAGGLNEARTKTRPLLIDVPQGRVREITGELPGMLDVTWSPDARRFGFLSFVGGGNRTELNLCSVDDTECEVVGSPLRRAILLRLD